MSSSSDGGKDDGDDVLMLHDGAVIEFGSYGGGGGGGGGEGRGGEGYRVWSTKNCGMRWIFWRLIDKSYVGMHINSR